MKTFGAGDWMEKNDQLLEGIQVQLAIFHFSQFLL